MTSMLDDEDSRNKRAHDDDEWIDFEIILTRMTGQIGVIRYLDNAGNYDEYATATGEFFGMVHTLHDMAAELYAAYMSGATCVYCGREPQPDWGEEERHDDIVFFTRDGKTASAHRFCRNEALQREEDTR